LLPVPRAESNSKAGALELLCVHSDWCWIWLRNTAGDTGFKNIAFKRPSGPRSNAPLLNPPVAADGSAALAACTPASHGAEFGEHRVAISDVRDALALAAGRNVKMLGALALARAGDTVNAEAIARELATDNSKNTVLMLYRLPSIEAAIALGQGNPKRALELLETVRPYELGEPTPSGLAPLYPVYLRGQAYLALRDGAAAAAEFDKILGHPGIALNSPLGVLARLQRARAAVLVKDLPAARSDYRDFLALWKDADSDVPVFIAAKSELARLR
jgi:eukaryotic-like serine/threonine-protein kinase